MRSSASSTPETPLVQKRKRSISDPTVTPFNPRLKTDIIDTSSHETDRSFGARSPRSAVAERLSDLKINGPLSVTYFNGLVGGPHAGDGQYPKKVRVTTDRDDEVLDDEDEDSSVSSNGSVVVESKESSVSIKAPKPRPGRRRFRSPPPPGDVSDMEIQETPEPESGLPPTRVGHAASAMDGHAAGLTPISKPLHQQSTPPKRGDTKEHFRGNKTLAAIAPSSDIGSTQKQDPLKRTGEATDHEVTAGDNLDPDDDGTGINGIGFRPTPAEAWARAQRRKKQLSEWRARETKEARQRRSERRNKSEALLPRNETAMGSTMTERPRVRFAS